ncbi:uncharacterized protein LOC143288281 [Babylonia areolata]|uniref:uncharacterized protein LOC143288281 n=1 Tax=Babylonia areolata TaxID=304850 RepID=UPI003FCF7C2C
MRCINVSYYYYYYYYLIIKVPDVREVITLLYPASWRSAKEPDEAAILLKDKMLSLDLPSNLSCRDINQFQILGTLGQSSRKFVEKLEEPEDGAADSYNSNGGGGLSQHQQRHRHRKLMAVKSQASDVQTKIACMKQVYDADFCGPMGNYLLMREIFLLRFLRHPGLIGLLGYCLRGDQVSMELRKKGLVMVMEAGTPLTPASLSSLSWARRVKLALDVAFLLEYLQSSPLGSVGLPRVQLKDFVLVNHRSVKLTDLDEAILGERECGQSTDCRLQGIDVGVECELGLCVGLNHRINLRVVGNLVLDPVLRQAPPEEKAGVEEMLGRIRRLEVRSTELVNFLDALVKKYPVMEEGGEDGEGYQRLKDRARKRFSNKWRQEEEAEDEDEDEEEDDENGDTGIRGDKHGGGHTLGENPQPDKYVRLDSSNFPGQYDYPCPDSRVLWGCVMTFDTLSAAMDQCNSDAGCKSFVVFSPQPEDENRMTVVFKSSNSGSPRVNLGTTLFLSRRRRGGGGGGGGAGGEEEEDMDRPIVNKGGEEGREEAERRECVTRTKGNQEDALRSRERRLMAHMGLKGKLEKDWKRVVRSQSVASFTQLRRLSGQGSEGGSMVVMFNTSMPGHSTVTRAKFLAEQGAEQNHAAFALVYEIDRLLGLYHTPPAVPGFMTPSIVEKFSANKTWHSTFRILKETDGTLRGLYVAPTPKVMKRADLIIQPLGRIVSEVVAFDRTQKVQLEYVLLWWLGHISKPSDLHRGFKGHLIHVDADQGFQDPAVNYDAYFNHCQFPGVVYKTLGCFRCRQGPGGATTNKVCYLGQEVVRRLEETGFKLSGLNIPNVAPEDYPALINGAASRTLEIVEKCIKAFGRETVLY